MEWHRCTLLCLASFTQHYACEIYPYCSLVFHYIDLSQFIYSFHHQILTSIWEVSSYCK